MAESPHFYVVAVSEEGKLLLRLAFRGEIIVMLFIEEERDSNGICGGTNPNMLLEDF